MKIKTILVAPLLLLACGSPSVQQASVSPAANDADPVATITAADMRSRIGFLASDALRGRDTPSPGLDTAAAWIAREFQRIGLEPGGENGTFFQRYPFTILTIRAEGASWAGMKYGTDFFVWPGTPLGLDGEMIDVAGALADAPAATIRGKIPVVTIKGRFDRTFRTAVQSARNAAQYAGAKGLIVVVDSTIAEDAVQQATNQYRRTTMASPLLSVVFVRPNALKTRTGHVAVTIPTNVVDGRPPNVAGILRGSDPALRETYVVLSAHMDHVGVGAPDATGDSIYNGADDDASGTSAVIEIAEALAALPQRPARSVMFLLVSGEEKGLLGSRYFSDHPTVPLEKMVANVNIDMIARNAPDTVVAIGQEYSSLGPLMHEVVRAHPELGLTASRDLWPNERFFFRSDHFNFARKEVPAIFFFSGVHEDYHRPSDEVEKIDADKAARIARLAYYLTREIAVRREPPQWTAEGLREVRALTR